MSPMTRVTTPVHKKIGTSIPSNLFIRKANRKKQKLVTKKKEVHENPFRSWSSIGSSGLGKQIIFIDCHLHNNANWLKKIAIERRENKNVDKKSKITTWPIVFIL
jgi:hypothetical protein